VPEDDLRAVYDQRAREYVYHGPRGPLSRKHRGIIAHLPDLHGLRFLEVGCGDGPYLTWVSQGHIECALGVDLSPRILLEAKKRVQAEGHAESVHLAAADAVALPFAAESFDLVLASQVIEHVPDDAAALRAMRRVLRPGGLLVISTDHRDNRVTQALAAPTRAVRRLLRRPEYQPPFPHRSYTQAEFSALVRDAGLHVVECTTFRFSWPRWIARLRPLVRALDAVEQRLIRHPPWSGWGDIVLVVAKKA
jgi:ubiquinone/menaquinone biosynthesis C-methylase UbiE